MSLPRRASILASVLLSACSSSPATVGTGGHGTGAQGTGGHGTGGHGTGGHSAGGSSSMLDGGPGGSDGGSGGSDAGMEAGPPPTDTLPSNRDRLLGTYFDYLKASVTTPQSNGLSGSD